MLIFWILGMTLVYGVVFAWVRSRRLLKNTVGFSGRWNGRRWELDEPLLERFFSDTPLRWVKTASDTMHRFTLISANVGYFSGITALSSRKNKKNSILSRPEKRWNLEKPGLYLEKRNAGLLVLQALKPDVVAFQEVDVRSKRSFQDNQMEGLAHTLGLPFASAGIQWDCRSVPPFHLLESTQHFFWPGNVLSVQTVQSAYPLRSSHSKRFPMRAPFSTGFGVQSSWVGVVPIVHCSVLDVGMDQTLTVVNVHINSFVHEFSLKESNWILRVAEWLSAGADWEEAEAHVNAGLFAPTVPVNKQKAVVVCGDFNASAGHCADVLEPWFSSSYFTSATPTGVKDSEWFTHPTDAPYLQFQYIFYSKGLTCFQDSVRVVREMGEASDHFPLMGDFALAA